MFARVSAIVAVFGPGIFATIVGPLAAALVVTAAGALAFDAWSGAKAADISEGESLTNPFELKTVLAFGAMLAAVVVVSRVLTELFGGQGGVAFAALAGLGDVDAITLSMTRVAGGTVSVSVAAVAVLVAVSANSMSKSALALVTGPRTFGLAYLAVSLSAIAAGGLVALAEAWSF
jgi:uncharacterized membrane protein (DUF4010 family)